MNFTKFEWFRHFCCCDIHLSIYLKYQCKDELYDIHSTVHPCNRLMVIMYEIKLQRLLTSHRIVTWFVSTSIASTLFGGALGSRINRINNQDEINYVLCGLIVIPVIIKIKPTVFQSGDSIVGAWIAWTKIVDSYDPCCVRCSGF